MTAQPDERLTPDRGHGALVPKPAPRPDWSDFEAGVQRLVDEIEGALDKLPKRGEP